MLTEVEDPKTIDQGWMKGGDAHGCSSKMDHEKAIESAGFH